MGSSFSSVNWPRLPLSSSPSHSGVEEGERLLGSVVDSVSYEEEQQRSTLLDIDYGNETEARFGLDVAEPFDVFVHVLEWLDAPSLAMIATLSHAWKAAAYDSFLWNALDLSLNAHKVSAGFLSRLLCSSRFMLLSQLNLNDCIGLEARSLHALQFCLHLQSLSLARCRTLCLERSSNFGELLDVVRRLAGLRHLEIFGCVNSSRTHERVIALQALRPSIELGLFALQDAAGTEVAAQQHCRRRGDRGFAGAGPGCWGDTSAQLVFSNSHPSIIGNVPSAVIYSCVVHSDLSDLILTETVENCRNCLRFFEPSSMKEGADGAERICRVCADRVLLRSEGSWLDLRSMDTISGLQLDSMSVMILCQNRNLPPSLRRIACHNISAHVGEENAASNIRMQIQDSLYQASRLGNSRCLLLQEDDASVSVWGDSRAVVKGSAGARALEACLESWTHFDGVVLPFVKCMLIAAVFAHIVPDFSQSGLDAPDTINASTIAQQRAESTDFDNVVFLVLTFIITLALTIACLSNRFRERFRVLFRRLLLLDFFLIFTCGSILCSVLFLEALHLKVDLFSWSLLMLNVGVWGTTAIYFRGIPPSMQRSAIFTLNTLMSIIMLLWLDRPLIIMLLFIPAFIDLYSFRHPARLAVEPFLLFIRRDHSIAGPDLHMYPPEFDGAMFALDDDEVPDDEDAWEVAGHRIAPPLVWSPHIVYVYGSLRLRSVDLIWVGTLMALPTSSLFGLSLGFTTATLTLCFICLWAPLLQLFPLTRPLPFMLVAVIIASVIVNVSDRFVSTLQLSGIVLH